MTNDLTKLTSFWEASILPKYGNYRLVIWGDVRRLGPDELVVDVSLDGQHCGLFFEDHGGRALTASWVGRALPGETKLVQTLSGDSVVASKPTPDLSSQNYTYEEGVTGTFTLYQIV